MEFLAQQRGTSLIPEAEQNAGEVLGRFPRLRALFAVSCDSDQKEPPSRSKDLV